MIVCTCRFSIFLIFFVIFVMFPLYNISLHPLACPEKLLKVCILLGGITKKYGRTNQVTKYSKQRKMRKMNPSWRIHKLPLASSCPHAPGVQDDGSSQNYPIVTLTRSIKIAAAQSGISRVISEKI